MNKPAEKASISSDDMGKRSGSRTGSRKGRTKANSETRERDRLLVKRAKAGDQRAFQELFQLYHRRAYSLAFGMVHNADDALDVVQDAFIKAHRYLDRFEGNSSFYTWFYRIVMNLAIDHIRKRKRARHVDFNDALAHHEDGAVGSSVVGDALLPRILGQDPGKALVRKEIRSQVALALEELSENHRAVLVMREFEGMSYQEMADSMDCSKGTIMSRLFHARKNMQRRLLELMGEDSASDQVEQAGEQAGAQAGDGDDEELGA